VEIGKTPASLDFLKEYIKVFSLNEVEAYELIIAAYSNFRHISVNMDNLRILDREYFTKLLTIVKFFSPEVGSANIETHNLRNAIDAIWKLSIPQNAILLHDSNKNC